MKILFFMIVFVQGTPTPMEKTQEMPNIAACYEYMGEVAAKLKIDPRFQGIILMGCNIEQRGNPA